MANSELPRMVAVSIRIYTRVLWLCPRRYRREYGGLMVQAFRDLCCDAYQRGAARGVLRVWPRALLDLCLTAAGEHLAGLRARALAAQAAGIALLVLLIAAALGPALGPLSAPTPEAAKAPVAGDRPTFRPAESHVAFQPGQQVITTDSRVVLEPGEQVIVARADEPGATRRSFHGTGGQVVALDGSQSRCSQLAAGSRGVIFYP